MEKLDELNLGELRDLATSQEEQPKAVPISETKPIVESAPLVIDTPPADDIESIIDFGDESNIPEEKVENMPSAEELGGGIVIENKPIHKDGTISVGPMANKDTSDAIGDKFKEFNEQIEIHKKLAAATGEVAAIRKDTIVNITIDKVGLGQVEFTNEERSKMAVSKKINLVEVSDETLRTLEVRKVSGNKAKSIIHRIFDKACVPFIATISGYKGKVRNLTSLEVISLAESAYSDSIPESEALLRQASVVYSKLKEVSVGMFPDFKTFIQKTGTLDLESIMFALLRATYPQDDSMPMICVKETCTSRNKDGKVERNKFEHKYSNDSLLLLHLVDEQLKSMVDYINDNSVTVEDAIETSKGAILNNNKLIALDNYPELIFEIYAPSIEDTVERIMKPIMDTKMYANKPGIDVILNMTNFIYKVIVKETLEDGSEEKSEISDPVDIVELLSNMVDDPESLNLLFQAIEDNILKYQFKYGFKGGSIVCPHCGNVITEDQPIDISTILFQKAQQAMTKDSSNIVAL